MNDFSELYSLTRTSSGMGVNHENQNFEGTFKAQPVIGGRGLKIEFKAVGKDGAVFHEEVSMVGPGFNGKPCLFVLSNNHPGVTPHELKTVDKTEERSIWVFGFGDIANTNSFREEIALEVWKDGSVEYTYFWGLPGGEFKRRPGVKMLAK